MDRRHSQPYIENVLALNNITYVRNISLINVNPSFIARLVESNMINDKNLTQANKKLYGFDLNFMLLTCTYNGARCNSSDFIWLANLILF